MGSPVQGFSLFQSSVGGLCRAELTRISYRPQKNIVRREGSVKDCCCMKVYVQRSIVHGIQVCWLGLHRAGESCRAELTQTVCRASTFRIVPLAYLFVGQYVSRPDSCRAELTETVCRVSTCRKVSLGCLLSVSMYLDRSVVSRRARVFCGLIPSQRGRIQSTENSGRNHGRWYKVSSPTGVESRSSQKCLSDTFFGPKTALEVTKWAPRHFPSSFCMFYHALLEATWRSQRALGVQNGLKTCFLRVFVYFSILAQFWLHLGSFLAPF